MYEPEALQYISNLFLRCTEDLEMFMNCKSV